MANDLEIVGGRANFFGPRVPDQSRGSVVGGNQLETQLEYEFNWDELPDADVNNEMVQAIPANAHLISTNLRVIEAGTAAVTLNVGLKNKATGADIDLDGLIAASAADAAANTLDVGAGALVGAEIGDNDAVVAVTPSAALDAGRYKITVVYVPIGADVA